MKSQMGCLLPKMYFLVIFLFLEGRECFGLIECLLHKPVIPLQARKCFLTQKHQAVIPSAIQ